MLANLESFKTQNKTPEEILPDIIKYLNSMANTLNYALQNIGAENVVVEGGTSLDELYALGALKGDKGDPGNTGAKGANWRGAYASGTAYVVDDIVSYSGSCYICISASTGNAPTNTTYWSIVAAKGDKGDIGYGVPVGGTTGQILTKVSNTDYDTEWVTP